MGQSIGTDLNRRSFLEGCFVTATALATGGLSKVLAAQSTDSWEFQPDKPIIPAPDDPALWPSFRDQLAQWRQNTRQRIHFDDSLYQKPEFAWAASAFSCYFLMMCDQVFYDFKSGGYTVDSLLDEGSREFGGFDSVVLWHAYPRIGVDQRNQFDFYRDMPGGLDGLRDVVQAFQKRGVRVYIDYNPWDTGTRREAKSDADMLAEMVRTLDVDGIFLDTLARGGEDFRAKLDAARPGVILEGELTPPIERVADHHASWAQWFKDSQVPGVLRLKWFERRHMQHEASRWSFSHVGELHTAWMNGSGMMVWENIFGAWVPMNARDRSMLRSMLPVQRRFASLFHGEAWTPLVPVAKSGVYASLWSGKDMRLWTLVNRNCAAVSGKLLQVSIIPGQRYFDLIAGRELRLDAAGDLDLAIPAKGLGCLLAASTQSLGADFEQFLTGQAATQLRADLSVEHPRRETLLKPFASTARVKTAPEGMAAVHPRPNTVLSLQMRVRECGFYESMTENESGNGNSAQFQVREFERPLRSLAYAIDETPVTNAQFAVFLRESNYHPKHTENFLKHWDAGQFPSGKADHPVVWVDLDDARAYAAWAGKRLPTEEEWQFAAQGPDGREYPWSGGLRAGVCNLGETGDTTPVNNFPAGKSPYGCYDMCGNVWQWTESERDDSRTRFCMIRGGSYFDPQGSHWYVDGGPRAASFSTKFLLMWPGLDRCATIGFRCAVDLES